MAGQKAIGTFLGGALSSGPRTLPSNAANMTEPAIRLKDSAPRIGLALGGWLFAIGGVLLFGLHPLIAVAALLLAMSPTLFRCDQ